MDRLIIKDTDLNALKGKVVIVTGMYCSTAPMMIYP